MDIEKYLNGELVSITGMMQTFRTLTEAGVTEITENDFCAIAGKYSCDFCGKYFIRKKDLEEHKRLRMYEEELEERFQDNERL